MRKLDFINTARGIMVANEDESIHKEFSDYSVINRNFNFFVVDRNEVIVESAQDKAPSLFHVATQGNKLIELVNSGVEINLASNKIDTEGLIGAIKMAIESNELEHIPEIRERLTNLSIKLITAVNEPLKAKEKQILGVKLTSGIHRTKTVVEAFRIVNKMNEELKTFNSNADVYHSTDLDKNKVQRAYKIVEKVGKVKNFWLTLKGTMPYKKMISTIAEQTGAHPTNVEEWLSEFKANNPEYLIEI